MRVVDLMAKGRQRPLTAQEAEFLLSADEVDVPFHEDLFAAASEVRLEEKGKEFILDGFGGTVADCTVDPPCHYCARSSGRDFPAPLDAEEVREAARFIESAGSKRMEIGAGTNPEQAGTIIECARAAAEASHLEVWVNAGPSFSHADLEEFRDAGVKEVGASLETINPAVFGRVKPGDSLSKRMRLAKEIKAAGLKLMSVMMVGLGSTTSDYVKHLFWLKELGVDHLPITGLNPMPGTPLANESPASPLEVCRMVAVARLVLRTPDISTGGMMNDPRLLPLQIMAGANRAIHLGAHVHRKRPAGSFRMWPVVEQKEVDGLVFSNLRPVSERIIGEMGLVAA